MMLTVRRKVSIIVLGCALCGVSWVRGQPRRPSRKVRCERTRPFSRRTGWPRTPPTPASSGRPRSRPSSTFATVWRSFTSVVRRRRCPFSTRRRPWAGRRRKWPFARRVPRPVSARRTLRSASSTAPRDRAFPCVVPARGGGGPGGPACGERPMEGGGGGGRPQRAPLPLRRSLSPARLLGRGLGRSAERCARRPRPPRATSSRRSTTAVSSTRTGRPPRRTARASTSTTCSRDRWYQTWVDNSGGLHEYKGGLEGANMVYFADLAPPPGQTGRVPTRLTFFNLDPNHVRQLSESTADGGKTWTVNYDLIYTRRPPSPPREHADLVLLGDLG